MKFIKDILNSKKRHGGGIFLLVSHELSNSGAPRALLNLAKTLISLGGSCILVSYYDGQLREDFEKLGVNVHIIKYNKLIKYFPFLYLFKAIICSSIVSYKTVNLLNNLGHNVYWWLHEAQYFASEFVNNHDKRCLNAIKNCKKLYCISEFSKSFFQKYNKSVNVLGLTIQDEYEKFNPLSELNKDSSLKETVCKKNNSDLIKIVYFGEVIPLKGQDIFMDYFRSVDENTRDKYCVKFIGRKCDEEFLNKVIPMTEGVKNVEFTDGLEHKDAMKELNDADIFVLLSRCDSFSISALEAMMFDKPIILSPFVGLSSIVKEENIGFVAENKNEFLNIINNKLYLNVESSRKVFEKRFSFFVYQKKVKEIFF